MTIFSYFFFFRIQIKQKLIHHLLYFQEPWQKEVFGCDLTGSVDVQDHPWLSVQDVLALCLHVFWGWGLQVSKYWDYMFTFFVLLEIFKHIYIFFPSSLLIGGCYYAIFIILFIFNIIFNKERMNCSMKYWVGK